MSKKMRQHHEALKKRLEKQLDVLETHIHNCLVFAEGAEKRNDIYGCRSYLNMAESYEKEALEVKQRIADTEEKINK